MTDKTDAELDVLRAMYAAMVGQARDEHASLRKQLDEAREEKVNWKLRYEELKVDALDLHAANAQMAAALRGLLAWHRYESSIILDDLIDNADTALSQEPPASHAPGLRDAELAQARAAAIEEAKISADLRACLSELRAVVKGECPSLLDEDSGGSAELDMAIDRALSRPVSEREGPDWNDLRGVAPDATGDQSSEAFIREQRDSWER